MEVAEAEEMDLTIQLGIQEEPLEEVVVAIEVVVVAEKVQLPQEQAVGVRLAL
jgi:hypothetical protein